MKELLFSVTASDCEWKFTKGTGSGGQKKNKTSSACHCMHRPSGAHGYSEASRSQHDNKRDAFVKMANTKEFKEWHHIESLKRNGMMAVIDAEIEKSIKKVKIEVHDENGRWKEVKESELQD